MHKPSRLYRSIIVVLLAALVTILLVTWAFVLSFNAQASTRQIRVRGYCPEDAVIVGRGDYTGGQGWDRYVCIARDDL